MNTSRDVLQAAILSDREHAVLRLLADGMTARAIAARLNIRVSTVYTYIRRIYQKLDVTTRPQAVRAAVSLGLVEPLDCE
ncbi:MAG: helix-turn-helix transcriptional regulator [Pseudomonadota bacterium]|jgi:DNA-binding CsgD family transcriptional regulator